MSDMVPPRTASQSRLQDDDMARVDVSTTAVDVGEGSSATYTIELGFMPSADVTVTIVDPTESGTDVTTDPESLTFTPDNWNTPQEVTVNAASDGDTTDDSATITHTASGAEYTARQWFLAWR